MQYFFLMSLTLILFEEYNMASKQEVYYYGND